ncbi:MAG: DUF3575 domain-containing protein, partial [Gordonibacter sp.]|uniref:DUF3575 domain-containing protein n=1 Tax=Gordonibacter sp. TaxID=1968902 RepID=UPI002FC8E81E
LLSAGSLRAQGSVALKTNLLYGGYTATPNLGMEFGLNRHLTLEVAGGYNPWNLNRTDGSRKRVHYLLTSELRYFFLNRLNGHYLGAHVVYGQYNINKYELPLLFGKGSKAYRHEGSAYGGGLSYGYQFLLGRRWNLELGIGAGVMLLEYDKYDCVSCGEKRQHENRTYYGLTKASVSLIYIIK